METFSALLLLCAGNSPVTGFALISALLLSALEYDSTIWYFISTLYCYSSRNQIYILFGLHEMENTAAL